MKIVVIFAKIIFYFLKLMPFKKNHIVMECDYGKGFYNNLYYIYEELNKNKHNYTIIIAVNKSVEINKALLNLNNTTIIRTRTIKHLYYLATSKFWITNNHYYFFLKPRKDTIFINTWHSVGGIKNIGIFSTKDTEIQNRYKIEGPRIDWFLIGSEQTRKRCVTSLCLKEDSILNIGIPRTDPFFNEDVKEKYRKEFFNKYPSLEGKKILLYAPTFRDDEKENFKLKININQIKNALGNEYIVIVKLHSIIRNSLKISDSDKSFFYDMSTENINMLMFVSDVLITDYSSVFFDYSLLKKPVIFYPYDYEEYTSKRNFYYDYMSFVPGPIARTTDDVIDILLESRFDLERIERFSKEHCTYQDGKSSERFVKELLLS